MLDRAEFIARHLRRPKIGIKEKIKHLWRIRMSLESCAANSHYKTLCVKYGPVGVRINSFITLAVLRLDLSWNIVNKY